MYIEIFDQQHKMVFEGSKDTEPSIDEIHKEVTKEGFEPFNVETFFDKLQGFWRTRGEIRRITTAST